MEVEVKSEEDEKGDVDRKTLAGWTRGLGSGEEMNGLQKRNRA